MKMGCNVQDVFSIVQLQYVQEVWSISIYYESINLKMDKTSWTYSIGNILWSTPCHSSDNYQWQDTHGTYILDGNSEIGAHV